MNFPNKSRNIKVYQRHWKKLPKFICLLRPKHFGKILKNYILCTIRIMYKIQNKEYYMEKNSRSWRTYCFWRCVCNVPVSNLDTLTGNRYQHVYKLRHFDSWRVAPTTPPSHRVSRKVAWWGMPLERQNAQACTIDKKERAPDCVDTQWVHSYRWKGERIIVFAINKWWRYCRYRCSF